MIAGCALSLMLAFAAYSMNFYQLLMPQAAGWLVGILLLGISGSNALFLFIMISINAVAYTGIIFVLLVALWRPNGK